jgi:hypothetical protein
MAGKRDYKAEYQRRQELAQRRGFASYWKERNTPRTLRSERDFERLPEKARERRTDALSVIHVARRERIPVETAARRLGVSMDTVTWYAGDALGATRGGKTRVKRGDRIMRVRFFLPDGADRVEAVWVRGSRVAADADAILDVQSAFIRGDASPAELDALGRLHPGGRHPETDPTRLEAVAAAGGFDIAEVYRELFG